MKIKIKYVSLSNGRWVYRPRKTKDLNDCLFPVDSRGFLKPPIKLGVKGDPEDKITRAYVAAKEALLAAGSYKKTQLGHICDAYLTSEKFREKAPATQRSYTTLSKSILSHSLTINGKQSALADMQLTSLTKPIMNKIRLKRLDMKRVEGKDGKVLINREVAFLSTSMKWGLNNIPELPKIINPLRGIDKFTEEPNERYVTNKEMHIPCKEAVHIIHYLHLLIRLSYLIGARGAETASLKYSDCKKKGLDVARLKGSKDNIISWSSALTEIIEDAKSLNKTRKVIDLNPTILTNSNGDPLTSSAIQSAMGRLKKRMKEKGLEDVFFTLHKTNSTTMD